SDRLSIRQPWQGREKEGLLTPGREGQPGLAVENTGKAAPAHAHRIGIHQWWYVAKALQRSGDTMPPCACRQETEVQGDAPAISAFLAASAPTEAPPAGKTPPAPPVRPPPRSRPASDC